MGPVACDQYLAAMMDGRSKYGPVLFGQDQGFGQQRSAGKQAADLDSGGHGFEHGKTAWGFCGQVAPRLLEDVGICPQFMACGFGQGQKLPDRAIGAGGREQNVGVEEDSHRVSAISFSERRPTPPPPRRIHADALRYTPQ